MIVRDDEWAVIMEHRHYREFDLDSGSLEHRYDVARKFTEKYFSGTPYYMRVEEFCCNSTLTRVGKRKENGWNDDAFEANRLEITDRLIKAGIINP